MNAALDHIEEVLNETELEDIGKKQLSMSNVSVPEIKFNHVKFSYGDKEVLHDVNFEMQKNTITALVGQSGGGKSTVANLLKRFWDVDSGEILIRGINIKDISLSEFMSEISMVFQRI
ncbi:ABC-type multidrug transport system fused ATPase/permease subunit [Peptostreptococcus canis]|nr:ABC-type multidrug transport system fused ATPase/permease subunit [Peptostreptococcus canis]